jgi:hypothetical protein
VLFELEQVALAIRDRRGREGQHEPNVPVAAVAVDDGSGI